MQDDDALIIQRCLDGDLASFEVIVDRYQRVVFNAAFRVLNDHDDASDVSQAVFIKVFENLKSFNRDLKFFSWLYRITINESLNFNKQKRRLDPVGEDIYSNEKGPDELLHDADISDRIQSALMTLSLEYRVVLVLNYFHDLSYREIGFVLEIPEKTVKSRLFTARQLLKERLLRKGVVKND